MITNAELRSFATRLRIAPPELLCLAREIQQDACMPSLAHMTVATRELLMQELAAVSYGYAARRLVLTEANS